MNLSNWMNPCDGINDGRGTPDAAAIDDETLTETMNAVLVAVFALYVKSRSFRWHANGSRFDESRRLLEVHGDQLYAMLQPIVLVLRARGKTVFGPIGHLPKRGCILDGEAGEAQVVNFLLELREDNGALLPMLRRALSRCESAGDDETVILLEEWVGEALQRASALEEIMRFPALVSR